MNLEERKRLEEELTDLLRVCGHRVFHSSARGRGQTAILQLLSQNGAMPQKDIQERMNIQSGSLSELVNKLEGRRLLVRERDERDRRRVLLCLTPAGEAAVRHRMSTPLVSIGYDGITDGELQTLLALLNRVKDGWKEEPRAEQAP
ncbi:MAG: winged helix-turn-helix transcriptional regulator [Clostridia bacterium]|nr:winged helix-turn-helix transcriptional regulator [Clostridia bacterium]